MPVLIFGRAIQGVGESLLTAIMSDLMPLGASGMFVSILAVIAVITRVDQRAAFMSFFGYVTSPN
jgi:hypothetical protein